MSEFSGKNKRKSKTKKKLMFLFARKAKKKPQRSKSWGMLNKEKKHTFFVTKIKKRKVREVLTENKIFKKKSFQLGVIVLIAVLSGAYWIYHVITINAASATKTITAQTEWEAGEFYAGAVDTKTTAGNLKIQSGAVGTWNAGTPGFTVDNSGYDYWSYDGNSYGAGMATDGKYIYQIVGNRRPYLFRFNPETGTWKQMANAPTSFYYGGAITYDAYSKSLFAIDGGDAGEVTNTNEATKHIFKYDIATDTWSRLADAPDIWTLGSVITSDGAGKIYAMRSYYSAQLPDAFWYYNQVTGTWNDTLPMPQTNFSSTNGQALIFVNEPYPSGSPTSCITGCIFALGGGSTANFYRYDITENQWYSTVTGMGNAGYGASLAYDSTNGNIYAHNGNAGSIFAMYDVSAATWALKVNITGGGTGTGAEAIATISGGAITGYTVQSGGGYYSSTPTVTIAGGGGSGATATATLTGGRVTAVNVVLAGSGYTTTPAPRNTQGVISYGGSSVYLSVNGTGYIYQTRGYAVPDMLRYNITSGQWESVETPTTNFTTGNVGEDGLVVYVATGVNQCLDASGCLFVFRGANTATFWRYNIGEKTWTTNLTATNLGTLGYGSSVCKAGNTLYALRGGNTVNFYSYDLTAVDPGGVWSALTSMPTTHTGVGAYPASPTATNVGYGGGVACLGSTVYAMKGFNSSYYSNHFYSYTGGAWSQQTVAPQRMGAGGAIVAVPSGASCADATGCIFALMGNQRGDWYRYNISATTWTKMTDIPTATAYTASLTYDGAGNIYAISGDYDNKMWRFNIVGDSWSRVADLPGKVGYNNAMTYDTVAGIIYAQHGFATGQIWKFTPTANNYISATTWISGIQDLDYVGAWEQLSSTLTSGGTSNVDIAIRSSIDKVSWSDWETLVTGGTGPSVSQDISAATTPQRRYAQIRIILNSDGTNTPSIDSVTLTYTKDGGLPVNPTATGYSNSTKTTTILTGTSNYYTNPYFELSGGTDAGSGLAGYYVAWTTDSNLNPSTSEDYFQTDTTYRVNSNMQTASPGPTYYLRVAAKDNADNVAAATTAFTYTYNGIAASSATVWNDSDEFGLGTDTNVNTIANANADMTLDGVSPGTWMDLPAVFGTGATQYSAYNDTSIVWDGSNTIYALRSVGGQIFYKYTISTKTWSALANTGVNASSGAAIVYVPAGASSGCTDAQGCVFATMGGGTTAFRRYNIQANTWDIRAVVSGTVNYGAGLIYPGGDYIYASRGGGALEFYRFQISTNTWGGRASVEGAFNYGASYAYVPNGSYCADSGGCIFATRGAGTNHFLKYGINDNSWSYLTAPPTASPVKANYGATMTYNNGYLYFITGYASTDFLKYDILNDFWTTLADLPATHYYGSTNAMVFDTSTNTIYTPRMYNEYSFISYDVTNNKWRNPTIPQGQSSNGFNYGGVAFDGSDTLYVARGINTNDFYKYTISTQVWQRMNDIPIRMNAGSDLIYINGTIYALTGTPPNAETYTRLYSYNPTTDAWTRLADMAVAVGQGADLVWDGSNTIYTARGAGNVTMYAYYIATVGAMTANTWVSSGNIMGGGGQAMNEGSCAVVDDSNTSLYMVQSNNTRNIYKCNISQANGTCAWQADTLTDAPAGSVNVNLRYGASCTLDGNNIFVPRGDLSNTDFLVYSISGNSWTTRVLNNFHYYGRLLEGPNNILYGFRGYNTSTMDRYVQQTATTSFERIGTWTSQIVDLGSVYGFGGLSVNDSLGATNTSMKYETRTCSDAGCSADANDVHWSAWSEGSAKKTVTNTDYFSINSTVARYLQVKVTFDSDRIYTPTVNDFTLSYYVDGTDPNNPASPVNGYTNNSKTTGINNNTWTNDSTPYFEWTSSDNAGGIGIEGYYVYFGTDITKDPVNDANDPTNLAYFNGNNYYNAAADHITGSWNAANQSSAAIANGNYYLRIKTKDINSNITDSAVEGFTFKIDNSVPNNITDLSVATYMMSENNFSFSWTDVSDVGPSGVNNYCYHTGVSGDTCVPKETICSGGTCTVSSIPSYQPRVNTFYVMAEDEAGNDAASYASTGYFYTGGAPTLPATVTVDPLAQVDNNTFTVSWDLPGTCLGATPCAAADILRYCYTINELPSIDTCGANYSGNPTPSSDGGWTTITQSASRILPSFSAATLQGENIVYVVAMDVVSNIDYDNYQTATYDFTSNAPGMPASLQASDTSDRATNKYSVVLTWDEPADVGSGVESYKVYRCEANCESPSTTDDPPANYTNIAEVNTLGYLDTSLDNTITYSYFARSTGTGGTQSGNSAVVAIKPEGKFKFAPTISGLPTATAYIRSATVEWLTLNDQDQYGNIIEHPATSFVEYGTSAAYGDEDGDSVLTTDHAVTLVNLTPDTTYHYRCRWQDQDGNIGYSTDFTFTTKGAPSAPINLLVTPESNTTNSFTFTWDAPTDEGVTVAGYYYSINTIPNESNSTNTVVRTVGPIDAATQQGANTFYVVAIDDGGNINYANYASVDFEAYTTPPSSPQAITITDSSDRDASRYSITNTWDPPEGYAIGDEIYYTIYRKDATSVAQSDDANKQADVLDGFEEIATITSTGYLDTGLDNATEYFYQVTARDKAQATSEPTKTVSEIPEGRFTQPAAITEAPSVTPDSFSAVVTWRTERITTSFVEYGLSASNLTEEQGTSDQVENHEVKVTGLKPETKYYYRIKSIDNDENVAYSEVDDFTTLEAPRVLDVTVSDVKLYDAIIQWNTNKEVTSVVQYGTTTDYGLAYTDISGSFALTHTIKLEGLSDSTTYNIRIGGVDRNGNPVTSDNYTFSTLTFPTVLDVSYENKSEGQTEIFWTTNVPTTSEVEYYSEKIPPKTQGNTAQVTEHTILLFGLEDATLYNFKVRGSDVFGYEAISDEREFVTLEDTTPPTISGVKSESNTIGAGEDSKVQIIISWKTDEPTTSQVDYGVGLSGADYTDQTEENAELVMDHLAVVSGLSPAKTYHFRAVSSDKAGNQTKSGSYTVLTSRKRESFLQLIISNLEETFSWIGRLGGTF